MKIKEIQGLRGLALLLVVLFHLFGNGRISGGVDVFLVVSGFVVTLSLIRRFETNRFNLIENYSRSLRRLIPPAFIVIILSILAGMLITSPTRQLEIFKESIAAMFYYENFFLVDKSLSYEAAGAETSPFQHFWSLAIQGQFIILWPLLLLLIFLLTRHFRIRFALIAFSILLLTTISSFVYALYLVDENQSIAYFDSYSRFWELGVGGLLAFVNVKVWNWLKNILALAGLFLIVSCGFLIDGSKEFPGYWTLWPVAGTVLIILSANTSTKYSIQTILNYKPLQKAAEYTYELYLTHWPIMIFYMAYYDKEQLTFNDAAWIFTMSIFSAIIIHKITKPAMRKDKYKWLLLPMVISLAIGSNAAHSQTTSEIAYELKLVEEELERIAEAERLSSMKPDEGLTIDDLLPSPKIAENDTGVIPSRDSECITRDGDSTIKNCVLYKGHINKPTVYIVGGSHDWQWDDLYMELAKENKWSLNSIVKSGCRLGDKRVPESDCVEWNEKVIKELKDIKPDYIITLGTATQTSGPEIMTLGQEETFIDLANTGIKLITFRDNPRFVTKVPECVTENGIYSTECQKLITEVYADESPMMKLSYHENIVHLDLKDLFCKVEEGVCYPVIDNILVYKDFDHLTNTFAKTLVDPIRMKLLEAVPELFD